MFATAAAIVAAALALNAEYAGAAEAIAAGTPVLRATVHEAPQGQVRVTYAFGVDTPEGFVEAAEPTYRTVPHVDRRRGGAEKTARRYAPASPVPVTIA